MERTVFGSDPMNACTSNGRYRRTFTMPTFSPAATSLSTASRDAPTPEPISTITRSASGAPLYSNRLYLRPVSFAKRSMASVTTPGTAA